MTVPVLLSYTAWLLQQTPHLMCSLVRMLELTKEDFRRSTQEPTESPAQSGTQQEGGRDEPDLCRVWPPSPTELSANPL